MFSPTTKWHPLLPAAGELLLYSVFIPFRYVPFDSLHLHQQLVVVSFVPVLVGSVWWFWTANNLSGSTTPEERILDNE